MASKEILMCGRWQRGKSERTDKEAAQERNGTTCAILSACTKPLTIYAFVSVELTEFPIGQEKSQKI